MQPFVAASRYCPSLHSACVVIVVEVVVVVEVVAVVVVSVAEVIVAEVKVTVVALVVVVVDGRVGMVVPTKHFLTGFPSLSQPRLESMTSLLRASLSIKNSKVPSRDYIQSCHWPFGWNTTNC